MDKKHESIELRFRKRIGALLLNGVLCRQHKKRRRQIITMTRSRHPVLLHGFQQRCLGFWRRPVDFVG